MNSSELTSQIIGAAIEVHRALGPGLLESCYEACLCYELSQRGLKFERQSPIPVVYKEVKLDCGFKADLIVEDSVVVELKAVDKLTDVHQAQVMTHMRLTGMQVGLLINFNVRYLKQGLRRIVL